MPQTHTPLKRVSYFLTCLFSLVGCQSPLAPIKKDISRFKNERADNFIHYSVTTGEKNRPMTFAWSGDPKNPPLIFVHGSPGSWEAWAHFLLDENLQKKFHMIAVNRPGYEGSGKGATEPSLQFQAQAIIEALRFNQSGQPAILIGHSFGGPVIARMAMDHPQKVAGLIFIASSVAPGLEIKQWFQYPASWFWFLLPDFIRVCNEEIIALKMELEKMADLWPQITVPVAILHGEKDKLVSVENVEFIKAHVPAERVILSLREKDLNHFLLWEQPELLNQAIRALSDYRKK